MMKNNFTFFLLKWFQKNGRSYSFRGTSDPYRLLVCEILLRKTRAEQVENVYHSFFERFPDIESLADASVRDIREIIRPLGIISRADHLSLIAEKIIEEHDGVIPDKEDELISMRGVGKYVANCVLSFGYGKTIDASVDTNIDRVLSRVLGNEDSSWPPGKEVNEAYLELMPESGGRDFHHALIDLAHIVCRAKSPQCDSCPVSSHCLSFRGGVFS